MDLNRVDLALAPAERSAGVFVMEKRCFFAQKIWNKRGAKETDALFADPMHPYTKALLYAHATGALTQENMEVLASQEGKLSLVSLDCTQQRHRDGKYHMGFSDCLEQKERLIRAGLADEGTVWILNHFSHNGGWLHEELSRTAERYGFLAAYDTMSIDF